MSSEDRRPADCGRPTSPFGAGLAGWTVGRDILGGLLGASRGGRAGGQREEVSAGLGENQASPSSRGREGSRRGQLPWGQGKLGEGSGPWEGQDRSPQPATNFPPGVHVPRDEAGRLLPDR